VLPDWIMPINLAASSLGENIPLARGYSVSSLTGSEKSIWKVPIIFALWSRLEDSKLDTVSLNSVRFWWIFSFSDGRKMKNPIPETVIAMRRVIFRRLEGIVIVSCREC